jgi:hypothetical protein
LTFIWGTAKLGTPDLGCAATGNLGEIVTEKKRKEKKKKIDHEGGFQGALLLQSTTKEGKFMADQVEPGSV